MQLTHDGVAERSRERSRFLIVRQGTKDADALVLRLPEGQSALPAFGLEEEAGMFLWLEGPEKVGASRRSRKQTSAPCCATPARVCGGSSIPSPLRAWGRGWRPLIARTSRGRCRATGAARAKRLGPRSHLGSPHG